MTSKLRLTILLALGILLIATEVAIFQGDLKPLFAREVALGLEIIPYPHQTPIALRPSDGTEPEGTFPPKCYDEKILVVRPQRGGYTVRLPASWQSNEYQGASTDFHTVCSLSGMLDAAYGADGELHTNWEMHQLNTTADAWFKTAVEVKEASVRATIASLKRELQDSTLSPADFHSERSETKIDGRRAILYTTYWDKNPYVEGGSDMERFYIVADEGKIYVFRADIKRGPHERVILGLFDEAVKTVRFGTSTI
jgi:hypothetical protein